MEFIYYMVNLAGMLAWFLVVGAIACLPILFVTGALDAFWPGSK